MSKSETGWLGEIRFSGNNRKPSSSRWPRPTPPNCRDCGSTKLEGLGPVGNWDGKYAGGIIYQAKCLGCGQLWTLYAWGSGKNDASEDVHWGKDGSATDPPTLPSVALINPVSQVEEGQIVSGTVVNVAEFGLFVSLAPRLDGRLIFDRTPYPEIAKALQKGDSIDVLVHTINFDHVSVYVKLLEDPTRYDGFWSRVSEK